MKIRLEIKNKEMNLCRTYARFLLSQMENIFVGVIAPRAAADRTIVEDARIMSDGDVDASANANKIKPIMRAAVG